MKNSKISAFLKKYIVLFILLCAVFTFLKTIIYILPNESNSEEYKEFYGTDK